MRDKFLQNLKLVFSRLLAFLKAAIGDFNYQPPAWIGRAKTKLATTRAGRWASVKSVKAGDWLKANQKRAWIIGASTAAGIAAIAIGVDQYLKYLDSLPKPDYVTVSVEAPAEPSIETGLPRNLVVQFSKSAARIDQLGKKVDEFITLSPKIKGEWRWTSDTSLVFTPDAKENTQWEIGKEYEIEFSKKLFPEHVLLEELDYEFQTPEVYGTLTKSEFYQDPKDPKVKRAVFNLRYNYVLDTEDFKKRVHLKMQPKDSSTLGEKASDVPFSVSFNDKKTEAYILSESLPIPKKDAVVKLQVAEGVRAPRGGSSKAETTSEVLVPGIFEKFKFDGMNVLFARNEKFEPEQILVLTTKAEIASEVVEKALKLYLLPKRKPDDKYTPEDRNSQWTSASEVTKEVRKNLQPVKFTLVPSAEEHSFKHTFKIDIPVGRYLFAEVKKGLKSYGGYELFQDYSEVTGLPEYPRELMIMSAGSLLSLSGDKKIPLLARNLHDVDFTLYRVLPQQLNQFVYQSYRYGGSYSSPSFNEVQKNTLTEVFHENQQLQFVKPAQTQYFSLDLAQYLNGQSGRRGLFYVYVTSQKTGESDQRLIVVTDLGVIVKETNDGSHEVFVQNLRTGAAVPGANVEVIGANGLAVVDQTTNAEGRASFPDLKDFKNEKEPLAFVVKKDGDLSFLPYRLQSQSLSYSNFDVGGLHESKENDQLTAFLFSDRGIYRPGDSVNVGLMVRARNAKNAFNGVPIVWAVTDARGTEIHREKLKADSNDLASLSFKTEDTSSTGNYSIQVFIERKDRGDELIGSLSVRVEEFLPDRMRIEATISEQTSEGWIKPTALQGLVSLKNLFGTPAEARRVVGEVALTPTHPYFRAYKDYSFVALKGDEKSFTETLASTETDADGKASFDLDLERFGTSLYNLRFNAEGYESKGGRAVAASAQTLVSSKEFLIGLKALESLSYLKKNSDHSVNVIAIDPKLKMIPMKDLKAVIIERKYISTLMQQSDGTYKYQSVMKETTGEPKSFSVSDKGSNFKLPTSVPGDYALVFKDGADTELNRIAFSVAGEANLSRSLEKNAELQLTLDKADYQPGSEIEIQIKGPYTGAGLITIERDKVFASKWFKTSTTSTVERIRIPEGLDGNAFVNVTFLRAPDSKEIYMSPLSFAVRPFSISLDSKRINLEISAPEKVKPGQTLKIGYKASKPTKLILYGVDEGILQVAKYKLPDPLTYFYQRRALQVKTFQLLDLLLPEYSLIAGLSAAGGDEDGTLSRNLNPFKRKTEAPVVFWSGTIQAGPEQKTFTYTVPDYFNGNIKIMAVAASGTAYGAEETGTLSRGDFVITSNVPTFVVPGDEFEVGIGLANQAEGTGDKAQVKLEISSPAFEVIGQSQQTIEVPEGREKPASFKLRAKAMLGSQPLRFTASAGGKSAKASVETSVRPALPYMTEIVGGMAPKAIFDVPVSRKLLNEFRQQKVTLSPLPIAMGDGLKTFLDGYPYGCSEQLTSKLFPYLVLTGKKEFKVDQKQANEMFNQTLVQYRSRQTTNGGFAMYDAASGEDPVISLYVTHALIEAKERGFNVPNEVYDRALGYLETGVSRDLRELPIARAFAYSRYLLARAGKVPGNDLAFVHQALTKLHKDTWSQDTAALYLAAAYLLVKKDADARQIIAPFKVDQKAATDYRYFYDGFVRGSQAIFIIGRHFPELLKEKVDDKTIRSVFAPLERGQYNTHSAAWSILALDSMFEAAKTQGALLTMALEEIQAKNLVKAIALPQGTLVPSAGFSDLAEKIRYRVPAEVPYYYSQVQAGFDRELPTKEIKKGLEITREYLDEAGKAIGEAKLGEVVTVRLRVRATGENLQSGSLAHVVLVDLLPSGLEPVLDEPEVASSSEVSEDGDSRPTELPDYGDGDGGEGDGDGYDQPPAYDDGGEGAFFQFLKLGLPNAYAQTPVSLTPLSPSYVDRREDRMIIYSSIPSEIREFTYKARAVAQGTFVVPPAYGEAMYDRSIQYRGLPGKFKVEAP